MPGFAASRVTPIASARVAPSASEASRSERGDREEDLARDRDDRGDDHDGEHDPGVQHADPEGRPPEERQKSKVRDEPRLEQGP